jgi:hypothetical protein
LHRARSSEPQHNRGCSRPRLRRASLEAAPEVESEGNQRQTDRPLRRPFDPVGSVRLAGLHHEPRDQDDRGD